MHILITSMLHCEMRCPERSVHSGVPGNINNISQTIFTAFFMFMSYLFHFLGARAWAQALAQGPGLHFLNIRSQADSNPSTSSLPAPGGRASCRLLFKKIICFKQCECRILPVWHWVLGQIAIITGASPLVLQAASVKHLAGTVLGTCPLPH